MKRYAGWAILALIAGVAQAEGQQEADNRWVTEVMATPSNSSPPSATLASGDTGNNESSLRDFFKKNLGHT